MTKSIKRNKTFKSKKNRKNIKGGAVITKEDPIDNDYMITNLPSAQAIYDYEGEHDDELTFNIGDKFADVKPTAHDGWVKATTVSGKTGLAPSNYLKHEWDEDLKEIQNPSVVPKSLLSLKVGDTIYNIHSTTNDRWLYGTLKGDVDVGGFFPKDWGGWVRKTESDVIKVLLDSFAKAECNENDTIILNYEDVVLLKKHIDTPKTPYQEEIKNILDTITKSSNSACKHIIDI
jgi:hypothetical protein